MSRHLVCRERSKILPDDRRTEEHQLCLWFDVLFGNVLKYRGTLTADETRLLLVDSFFSPKIESPRIGDLIRAEVSHLKSRHIQNSFTLRSGCICWADLTS